MSYSLFSNLSIAREEDADADPQSLDVSMGIKSEKVCAAGF
jgi:hypothetical protein